MSQWANQVGAAGEHIVCADLLMKGHRAMLAAATLPYDVVADVDGRLFRIAVKATVKPVARPSRPRSKWRYQFAVQRRARLNTGRNQVRSYTSADVELVALVAMDVRRVAYLPVDECPTTIWLEADTPVGACKFGPRGSLIAGFADYPFERWIDG